jgi:hypothetical protein
VIGDRPLTLEVEERTLTVVGGAVFEQPTEPSLSDFVLNRMGAHDLVRRKT